MAQDYQGRFIQNGLAIDYTPGADVAAGDVVVQGVVVGVAKVPIASGVLGALAVTGIYDMVKDDSDISSGDSLFWDADGDPVGGTAGTGACTKTRTVNGTLSLADALTAAVADPGDAGAIAVTKSGTCPLVTGGAETRTLAIPGYAGQLLNLAFQTDGGDCVVTVASGINQTGNNTLTFADAGDQLLLVAIENGAAFAWRIVSNDGVALSTV